MIRCCLASSSSEIEYPICGYVMGNCLSEGVAVKCCRYANRQRRSRPKFFCSFSKQINWTFFFPAESFSSQSQISLFFSFGRSICLFYSFLWNQHFTGFTAEFTRSLDSIPSEAFSSHCDGNTMRREATNSSNFMEIFGLNKVRFKGTKFWLLCSFRTNIWINVPKTIPIFKRIQLNFDFSRPLMEWVGLLCSSWVIFYITGSQRLKRDPVAIKYLLTPQLRGEAAVCVFSRCTCWEFASKKRQH